MAVQSPPAKRRRLLPLVDEYGNLLLDENDDIVPGTAHVHNELAFIAKRSKAPKALNKDEAAAADVDGEGGQDLSEGQS
jgi:hypothetical protein